MDGTPQMKIELILQDPSDATRALAYRWETSGEYHAALFVSGQMVTSRSLPNVDRRRARRALIEWAIELGFLSLVDFDDATLALDTMGVNQLPRRLRTVVDVLTGFT